MPEENKQVVPPFNKEDIIKIIRDAILNGTICSPKANLDPAKTYVLKVAEGDLVLVEEQNGGEE